MIEGPLNALLNALIAFGVIIIIGLLMDMPEQRRKRKQKDQNKPTMKYKCTNQFVSISNVTYTIGQIIPSFEYNNLVWVEKLNFIKETVSFPEASPNYYNSNIGFHSTPLPNHVISSVHDLGSNDIPVFDSGSNDFSGFASSDSPTPDNSSNDFSGFGGGDLGGGGADGDW